MMEPVRQLSPETIDDLASALREAASSRQAISLQGAASKRRLGGIPGPCDVAITTTRLSRLVQYEPRDLTISVQAGMRFRDLDALLAQDNLMLPLDPPFFDEATVGGVVAANQSGPRRRAFGTPRDMVIGMQFVTLEGAVVQSGGMVVKNAAGYDMAKLMIGSLGTLAAIAVVNFRLYPRPPATCTFLIERETASEVLEARNWILRSVLQPVAIDLLNPPAARRVGYGGFILALQAAGPAAVVKRYRQELAIYSPRELEGPDETAFWAAIREFTPSFLREHPEGFVVRVSSTLSGLAAVVNQSAAPCLARAGSGVAYLHLAGPEQTMAWLDEARREQWRVVVEYRPEAPGFQVPLWPDPGSDFPVMLRVKQLFDPEQLLNRGRLYGRI